MVREPIGLIDGISEYSNGLGIIQILVKEIHDIKRLLESHGGFAVAIERHGLIVAAYRSGFVSSFPGNTPKVAAASNIKVASFSALSVSPEAISFSISSFSIKSDYTGFKSFRRQEFKDIGTPVALYENLSSASRAADTELFLHFRSNGLNFFIRD